MKTLSSKFKLFAIKVSCRFFALLSLCGAASYTASAQVKIGHNAAKLDAPASSIILQLSSDTALGSDGKRKPAKAFVMPSVKATQRQQMEGTSGQSPVPEGLFIYNADSAMLELRVKEKKEKAQANQTAQAELEDKWKFLRYDNPDGGGGTFLKVLHKDLNGSCFPKEDGSNSILSIEKKETDFKVSPYVRPAYNVSFEPEKEKAVSASSSSSSSSSSSASSTTTNTPKAPRTRITYNGLTLAPGRDYKVELDPSTASAGTGGSGGVQKVKITFLTLVPEKWEEFDEFFVEYEVT